MSAEKLAFLQNFYTDVTLYMPAEPVGAPVAAAAPPPTAVREPIGSLAEVPTDRRVPVASLAGAPTAGRVPVGTFAEHPTDRKVPVGTFAEAPKPVAQAPGVAERLAQPDGPVARAGLPKSIPTATSVQLGDRLAGATAPAPPAIPRPVAPAAAPAVPPVQLTPFSTQGSNQQGIVVLVRLPAEQFQKLHRNVFLNKMLEAIGFAMTDVVLVNVEADLPVALASLRRELAATHILAFGKNLLDVAVRTTQIYEAVQFPALGLSYIASADVAMVEYEVSLKKRLWPGLKAMFLR